MNETNIKYGYTLMVREARGAILNPEAQISKAGAEFMPPGAQYWSQGRNTAGCNFSFQCNKLKKNSSFSNKKEIVIVPLTGQVL